MRRLRPHFRRVLHHHRLAVHPSVPHGLTSQFLAASLKALRRDRPDVWAVVTYAETDQGQTGTIYQATNAIYTGVRTKGNIYFRDRHNRSHTTHSLKAVGTWSERRREAARRGWVECKSGGKHRYVIELGTGRQRRKRPALRWAALPYPRRMAPPLTRGARTATRWRWSGLGGCHDPRVATPGTTRWQPSHAAARFVPNEGRGPPQASACACVAQNPSGPPRKRHRRPLALVPWHCPSKSARGGGLRTGGAGNTARRSTSFERRRTAF